MIRLSKLYDSYLRPEVCFFRSVFTHLQFLQPPFRQISAHTWMPPSLCTMPQIPGLRSQQKERKKDPCSLRVAFIPFLKGLGKVSKTSSRESGLKIRITFLCPSSFLSFLFSSAAPPLPPLLYFGREKMPIASIIQCAPPFHEFGGLTGFYGWGKLARG